MTPERHINQLKRIKRAYKHAAEPVLRTGSKHGGGWRARWRARRPALQRVEDGELEAKKPPVGGLEDHLREEGVAQRVVVGGADGRASGQRTLLSLSGSFSQLKLQLRQLVQLTCQATRMR